VSTPGSGGPQPPEQDPSQSGQPWGQQPPTGQPGQPQPGQPQPGQPGQQPWGAPQQPGQPPQFGAPQQPGQPGQPWGAPQGPGTPQGPGGAQAFGQPQPAPAKRNKLLPIIGGLVALVVAASLLFSLFGGGDPDVGDCIRQESFTEVEIVDCDSDEAEYKVLATDGEMTGDEFDAASVEELCTDESETTGIFWLGEDQAEDGTVYCAGPV